jgi:hypothetical protein
MIITEGEHTYVAVHHGQKHTWRVSRLWELSKELPIRKISLQEFANYLDNDFWYNAGARISTRSVATHCKKIIDADLRYPIILDQAGRLMDGMHRLAKAWILEKATINVVQFTQNPPADAVEDGV